VADTEEELPVGVIAAVAVDGSVTLWDASPWDE
jgi:hypothetical protein